MSGSVEHLDTADARQRRGGHEFDWSWLSADRIRARVPTLTDPVLIGSLIWTVALAAAAVTTPLWRNSGWLLVSPDGPSTISATAVAIALVGLIVVIALGITVNADRRVGTLAAATGALAVPALLWWGLLWREPISYAPVGLTVLTALAAPMLLLGSVMVTHAALSVVLAPVSLRRGSPLPTPVEVFVVCVGASLAVLGAGWLAVVVLAGVAIRAALLHRWSLTVLAAASAVAVLLERFEVLTQLVGLVGVPPWWLGVPVTMGLLWWGFLGLRRHGVAVTLAVQFGLLAVLVCGAFADAPGADLSVHLPLSYGVGLGLVVSTVPGLFRPRSAPSAQRAPTGRSWPGIGVGAGFLAIAIIAVLLVPPVISARLHYVPTDGAGGRAIWQHNRAGSPVEIENRYLRGDGRGLWWEEKLTGSYTMIVIDSGPGEQSQSIEVGHRSRLFHATASGIELRGVTGLLDGELDLGPGAVLLPTSPSVGDRWTGGGTGTLTLHGRQVPVSFELSGAVVGMAPPVELGVGLDCKLVSTELTVHWADGETVVADQSWWCPGQGVVAQAGEVDGSRFNLIPFLGREAWTGRNEPRIPLRWRPEELPGGCPDGMAVPGIPLQAPLVVDVRPGQDRFGLNPVDGCELIEPGLALQPGGRLLHATSLGTLYVVTSTTGAVTAHVLPRERLWQTVLPAPTRTAPVRVGRSLAVLDTRDRVTFLDLDTGEIRGELHVPGARTLTGAADTDGSTARVAITDRTGRVTLADENGEVTARIRTGTDLDHHQPLALHRQGIVAWNDHRIEVHNNDGSLAWQARRPVTGVAMVDGDMGPVLVVLGPDSTDGLDPATGDLRWSGATARAVAPAGDGAVLLTADGLQFVDSRGQVLATLPAPAITGTGQLTVFDGHIWLRWTDPVRGPLLSHWVVG